LAGVFCCRFAPEFRAVIVSMQREIAALHPKRHAALRLISRRLWEDCFQTAMFESTLPPRQISDADFSVSYLLLTGNHPAQNMTCETVSYQNGSIPTQWGLTKVHKTIHMAVFDTTVRQEIFDKGLPRSAVWLCE
jgi:hypothetical protein